MIVISLVDVVSKYHNCTFFNINFKMPLFRNRLVIFDISCNSFADRASKAISSMNNKHMIIMKPYQTPRSVVCSSTFSSSISSPNSGPESGHPFLILSSITIVSVRPNFVITLVSWRITYVLFASVFFLIPLFHNR